MAPVRNVNVRAVNLENLFDSKKIIRVPKTAPATPTAFGNPRKRGLLDTSRAARVVTVIAAINPMEEKATDSKRLEILLRSLIMSFKILALEK